MGVFWTQSCGGRAERNILLENGRAGGGGRVRAFLKMFGWNSKQIGIFNRIKP
jgi:hypothetical protein